jgi:hypothetical protein
MEPGRALVVIAASKSFVKSERDGGGGNTMRVLLAIASQI